MIRDSLPFSIADGVAVIDFRGDDGPERYELLLTGTCQQVFDTDGVRRAEVNICAADAPRRRALHRAGFRLEGVLRERLLTASGPADVLCYARLATDEAAGRTGFTAVMNTVTPRKRLISHMLLTDESGRVCILETTFKPDFELPGGILDVGETPRQGLVREIEEELGIRLAADSLHPLSFAATADEPYVVLLYTCRAWQGTPVCLEGEGIAWVPAQDLLALAMPPLDVPLARALQECL